MSWDQIETKWAAMTRRIRADWTDCRGDAAQPPANRAAPAPTGSVASATASDTREKDAGAPIHP